MKAAILLVLVFLTGAVTGVLLLEKDSILPKVKEFLQIDISSGIDYVKDVFSNKGDKK